MATVTRRALPVLVALALVACDEPIPPDQVALTVTVDPAVVPPGQASTITVTIWNYTDEDVTLSFDDCRTQYAIVDSTGSVVATSPACPAVPSTLYLGPGYNVNDTYQWPAAVSAPGTYTVYGALGGPAERVAGPATIVRQ